MDDRRNFDVEAGGDCGHVWELKTPAWVLRSGSRVVRGYIDKLALALTRSFGTALVKRLTCTSCVFGTVGEATLNDGKRTIGLCRSLSP